jgi:hypothetical protein
MHDPRARIPKYLEDSLWDADAVFVAFDTEVDYLGEEGYVFCC